MIAHIFVWLFGFDCYVCTACPRVVTDSSTPDSMRVPLCVHDYRVFRTVDAALQTETPVAGRYQLGSCGNGGNSKL